MVLRNRVVDCSTRLSGDHLCFTRAERGGAEPGAESVRGELRDHGFRPPVHDPQQEYREEQHAEEPGTREDADHDEGEPMRALDYLDFPFALRGDRLLDAVEARFDLFAAAFRGGFRVLPCLLHGAGVGGGVLSLLLDLPHHGLLLVLNLLIRLDNVLGPRGIAFGGLVLGGGCGVGFVGPERSRDSGAQTQRHENSGGCRGEPRTSTSSSHNSGSPEAERRRTGLRIQCKNQPNNPRERVPTAVGRSQCRR